MNKRKQSKNLFLSEYDIDVKNLIRSDYEDEILTKYFESGFDEKDMNTEDVYDFLISLEVPTIFVDKYCETLPENDSKFMDLVVPGLEDDGIIDFDRLVFFCCKLLVLRNNFDYIEKFWKVFITYLDRAKEKSNNQQKQSGRQDGTLFDPFMRNRGVKSVCDREITYPDLKTVIKSLKLDDKINDSLMIDMIANGSDNARPFVNFFDFSVLLGKMDELQ
ncbi:hypothetical protein DASC09_036830 [Saccharomycopsis crataegensis]|uniref:Uncharacterized protein n=1 Tax=Saccharomycopsis crataegensis TaxID=43959 RepID=A0AAV5QQC2_9ASCO|nr:hypothetical protein DASC09_036830 [Saccharomycopsis crataegensis]